MMNDIERIDNLDEYHNRLDCWVMNAYMAYKRLGATKKRALYAVSFQARNGWWIPDFVFQDEDARHFNHDIVKECQRRLGA
jgi:hypothetical protein